ncbi:MAG: ergothioneine biosynthesis protein EgtB [Planctomycetaceae bacterium]
MPHADTLAARPEAASGESLDLAARYRAVRTMTQRLCAPLAPEDRVVQSMPDASPVNWHLAHTTWFFEQFVLTAAFDGYRPFRPEFGFLFNSYYNAVGERHPRPRRGMLTRPTAVEIGEYRSAVDRAMEELFARESTAELAAIIDIGLHHEQQHQELLLTDVKHLFAQNPLRPAYRPIGRSGSDDTEATSSSKFRGNGGPGVSPLEWIDFDGGIHAIGHDGRGFAYDNESPRHDVLLRPFRLASRLVTCGEYLKFIEDDGYARPESWLSDGWDAVRDEGWRAPLYWERGDDRRDRTGDWRIFTLAGMRDLDPHEPVCHVSFYEADAFARWSNARLPTEAEWEVAATTASFAGNFVEDERFHPRSPGDVGSAADRRSVRPGQLFGDCWEWTASPYVAYPGYRPPAGALGEYNGKFMCNQMVLRGGSCATSRTHIRPTYRNFFPPPARWQFTGIRLAEDSE